MKLELDSRVLLLFIYDVTEVIYMLSLSLSLPEFPERPHFSVSLAVKMRPYG